MILREAILKKAASAGRNIPVFVHKFGFDADNESVAIVETMKGDIVTVFIEELRFKNPIATARLTFWEFIKVAFKAKFKVSTYKYK